MIGNDPGVFVAGDLLWEQRAARLAEQLRSMGIDPDEVSGSSQAANCLFLPIGYDRKLFWQNQVEVAAFQEALFPGWDRGMSCTQKHELNLYSTDFNFPDSKNILVILD